MMVNLNLSAPVELIRNSKVVKVGKAEGWTDDQMTVVTVLGTNHFNSCYDEPGVNDCDNQPVNFRRAFQFCLDIFGSPVLFSNQDCSNNDANDKEHKTSNNCIIDGFYNVEESMLFLHLNDAFDDNLLSEVCGELDSILLEEEFVPMYNSFRSKHCQSLLLLFSLSHFVILSSNVGHFETRYIHLFKTLDSVRIKVRPHISKLLSGLHLPKQWIENGRLCSPKVLFFFEIESDAFTNENDSSSSSVEEFKEWLNKKKRTLEEEIYTLLRKCRIVTDNSANSLFEVPDSPDYVFLYDKCTPDAGFENNNISTYSTYIQQFCSSVTTMKKPSSAVANTQSSSLSSTTCKFLFPKSSDCLLFQKDYRTNFHEFILGNINLVKRKLSENEPSSGRRRNFEYRFFIEPTWNQWSSTFSTLYDYIVRGINPDPRAVEAYNGFEAFVNVDAEYLEAQCAKMFPKVFVRYQKNIPEVYGGEEHQARLSQAINVYRNLTRGAAILPWLEKLTNKCETFWKNGHQQCSAISLHQQNCVRPIHRVPVLCNLEIDPFPFTGDPDLPELPHYSSVTSKSACNCGRNQLTRDDPFTIRDANYNFYRRKEFDCCAKLEEYELPVYAPLQEGEEGPGQISLQEMLTIIQEKSNKKKGLAAAVGEFGVENVEGNYENNIDDEDEEDFDLNFMNNPSQEFRRGNSLLDDDEEEEIEQNQDENNIADTAKDGDGDAEAEEQDNDKDPLSQQDLPSELFFEGTSTNKAEFAESELNSLENEKPETPIPEAMESTSKLNMYSRVEYLPGMLHSKSPPGLLPLFPSFSLTCLGSSSIYSHSSGVTHQSGFFGGFLHLLLPYDVKVKAEAGVSKPIPRVYRGTRLYSHMKRLSEEFNVKLFIGVEFECKKGHRFFLQTPDKVLMVPNNVERIPNLKEFASKIASSDIPLYHRCPCSNARDARLSMIAQLIRIHIVTPKAPVNICINPRIQPEPHAPIFSPGNTEPIKLRPSTYWILRLPYCYVDNNKSYTPPQDPSAYNGRLLRGLYEVVAMSVKETKEWESIDNKFHEKS